jgi:hypothetical protein
MPNYQDAKIYKLVCLNTGMIYVGSTCQPLCKRLAGHKAKTNRARSKKIIEEGNYIILLIELFPCNTIEELCAREYEVIQNTVCINRKLLTEEERKAYQAKWRAEHKDYHAKWCENHEGYKKTWAQNHKKLGKAFENYEQAITKN